MTANRTPIREQFRAIHLIEISASCSEQLSDDTLARFLDLHRRGHWGVGDERSRAFMDACLRAYAQVYSVFVGNDGEHILVYSCFTCGVTYIATALEAAHGEIPCGGTARRS